MKFGFTLFLMLTVMLALAQNEIADKANNVASEYQAKAGLTAAETQDVENLLLGYFFDVGAGNAISPTVQDEVDNIISILQGGALPGPLYATNVNLVINEDLSASDPTFNRIFGTSFNPSDLCQTQGTLSGSGSSVYYDVIEFSVTDAGEIDIEIVSATFDTYLLLYCNFDPLNPQENVIFTNDDGGSGLLSRLTDLNMPEGFYSLVVSSFSSGEAGNYEVEFRSDNGLVVFGKAVPVNYVWIGGIFLLIGLGVVVKRFVF